MGGGIPEIVTHGETGLLVADRKPEAFADAIRTLERDRALRRTMGLNARGVIESRFSETIVGNSYEALYRSLVAV
ncbi:MAG: glycosyltransferase [Nitrospira sp.]|nr:glycosyltransferase [Nitrospira sp.]